MVEGTDDKQRYKLVAETAIVDPASAPHRVNPLTQGKRLVTVGWLQSWI